MRYNQSHRHRIEALEWWRQLTRLEQLEIVWKYSDDKDFQFIATPSSQIQKLYIVATAKKTDSIEKNKSRIENREELREQRKKELKELIEKDKPTMKLYTREQMIEAFNYGQKVEGFDWIGDMIDSLDAIELPTDEDIQQYLNTFPYTKHLDDGQYNDGVIVGAELGIQWMRDKIQGCNNE